MKSAFLAVLLGGCLVGLMPQEASAITFSESSREWWRGADMSGRYSLAPNERLDYINLQMFNKSGRMVATSRGTFDSNTLRWGASGGHFALDTYRVVFYYTDMRTGRQFTRNGRMRVWSLNGNR
jgi:hypothetical protein